MKENEAIMILKALGADEITSNTQKKNGTSMWRLKTGETVAEYDSGYIRKIIYYTPHGSTKKLQYTCWQLNPTINTPYTLLHINGITKERVMIYDRVKRLEYLIKYASRKVNKQWEKIKNFETL